MQDKEFRFNKKRLEQFVYEILLDPGFFVPVRVLDFALGEGLSQRGEAVRLRAESGGKWRRTR